jgi:methionyl-tRNA formyltransferase
VLRQILGRRDVADVALLTHEPPPHVPDVRTVADEHGLWYSTESINKVALPFRPDIIASVYYRHIFKPPVIEACDGRIFNMHPSLLPRHRGCSSVPWAMIEGDTVTGVTFHYIDAGVDTGRILLQASVPILPDDTQAALYQRCMERGTDFWPAALELVKVGFPGVEQSEGGCYHRRGAPHDGEIPADLSDEAAERFIRAMTYPPYPYATYSGQPVESFDEYRRLRASRAQPVAGER